MLIDIEREIDEDEDEEGDGDSKMDGTDPNASYVPTPVHAPLYPKEKMEEWFGTNQGLCYKSMFVNGGEMRAMISAIPYRW